MKKIISILITVLLIISSFSFVVFAIEPVTLSLTSSEVYAGDEITLNLYVSGNSDISGATIDINYDATKLEFVSAKEGAILDSKANISIRNMKKDSNYVRFTYLSTSSSIISEGILMSVTFKALESASGETDLTISIPHPDDFISIDAEELNYETVNSKVKIIGCDDVIESTTEESLTNDESITEDNVENIIDAENNEDNNRKDIIIYIILVSALFIGIIFIIIGIIMIVKKKKS